METLPGKDNPADIPSRGLDINVVLRKELWLLGPKFLSQDESLWPTTAYEGRSESDTEGSVNAVMTADTQKVLDLKEVIDITKYNKLKKLLIVTTIY